MEAAKKYLLPTERQILQAWGDDFWHFMTSCIFTMDEYEKDPDLVLRKPFPRYPYLKRLAWDFQQKRKVIVKKPRQMLLSWLCIGHTIWDGLFHSGRRTLTISKREKDAFHLKFRTDVTLLNLPGILQDLLVHTTSNTKGDIEFVDGTAFHFLPTSPDIGRTYTATGVNYDEFAFHKWAEEEFASLQPTLSGGGWAKMVSTTNGVGNLYHQIWRDADQRGWHRSNVDWIEHPGRNDEWYQAQLSDLGPRKCAQEVDGDFLQSGAVVFDQDYLKKRGAFFTPSEIEVALRAARRDRDSSPFLIGIDTSEGHEGGDAHSLHVIHKETGRIAAHLHGRERPDVFARKAIELCRKFPGPIGIEKASSGGLVILEFERAGLGDRLYRHREYDQRGRAKSKLGWITSVKSKPIMISELEAALRSHEIEIPDEETLDELLVYEYKDSASEHTGAPEGFHDDRVISLGIAWQMRKASDPAIRVYG